MLNGVYRCNYDVPVLGYCLLAEVVNPFKHCFLMWKCCVKVFDQISTGNYVNAKLKDITKWRSMFSSMICRILVGDFNSVRFTLLNNITRKVHLYQFL